MRKISFRMDPNGGKNPPVNKLSREHLQERLNNETFTRRTVSFYKYVILNDPQEIRDRLFVMWNELDCLGRIYVASEGINAQMSIPEHNWSQFEASLRKIDSFSDVPFKIAVEDDGNSFIKLQVKVRKQIVADGLSPEDYDVTNVGRHLNAKEWNQSLEAGATVVDMRNFYESEIGHFEGAELPKAVTFREELPEVLENLKGKEDEKILLYCTGGVRCEKTSAYLKHHGFKDVNQLLGGVIDYTRQVKEQQLDNKFKGKNFVFDNRLGEQISCDVISSCHQCSDVSDHHTNCKNKLCNILFIQCNSCETTFDGCCSKTCQQIYHAPEESKLKLAEELNFVRKSRFSRRVD